MKQRAIFSLKNFPSSARTITVCELEGQGSLREETTNAVVVVVDLLFLATLAE